MMAPATKMLAIRRILVVDDHLDTAHTLAVLLRDMGYEVEFAISGRAALEVARRFSPDVVFLDLMLPDLDGCQIARDLRQQKSVGAPRIFAVTGHGSEDLQRRAREAGCEEYLLKPLDLKLIDSLIAARE